jgi:hypothetical protein
VADTEAEVGLGVSRPPHGREGILLDVNPLIPIESESVALKASRIFRLKVANKGVDCQFSWQDQPLF